MIDYGGRAGALLGRIRAQSWFVRLWFLPVWALLGVCRMAILTLKFERVARLLGKRMAIPSRRLECVNPAQAKRAREISRVIQSASLRTPWDSNCFTQAVAARAILAFYGMPCVVIFGIARSKTDGKRLAHAWVETAGIRVTGGKRGQQYAFLGAFGSHDPDRA